jgi:hypothetical protein
MQYIHTLPLLDGYHYEGMVSCTRSGLQIRSNSSDIWWYLCPHNGDMHRRVLPSTGISPSMTVFRLYDSQTDDDWSVALANIHQCKFGCYPL